MRKSRMRQKIDKLREEMARLKALETQRQGSEDGQISLTDPDARSMATSGRGSGVVGYNVQAAVDTEHHLIVAHDVVATGSDRSQLAPMAKAAKRALGADALEVVADRGYFSSEQILECDHAGVQVTLPKPETGGGKAQARFVKRDFRYVPEGDMYICPAGEALAFTSHKRETDGLHLRRYTTPACGDCVLKARCTTSDHRALTRWEHEAVLEDAQRRLDENPQAMRTRRETVEHPFGTIKARMGATHFLMKRLPNVKTETALAVLAYNLTRVMNILGVRNLMAAIRA